MSVANHIVEVDELQQSCNEMDAQLQQTISSLKTEIAERALTEKMLRERNKEIELLYKTSRQIGQSLDINAIYNSFYNFVSQKMDCDGLIISRYNTKEKLIHCVYYMLEGEQLDTGTFPPLPLNPTGQGIQSKAISTGKSFLFNDFLAQKKTTRTIYHVSKDGSLQEDLPENDKYPADENTTRSALIVPIKLQGRVTGVAQVTSYRLNAYSQADLDFLEAMVSQIAVASNNALLYRQAQNEITQREQAEAEIRRQNLELVLLNRVIVATAADLPLNAMLEIVCRELGQIFQVTRVTAALLDETKSKATMVAEYSANKKHPSVLNQTILVKDTPPFQRLLAQKTPLVTQNAPSDPRLQAINDWISEHNEIVSLLMLPLLVKNEVIGTLTLVSTETRKFSASEVDLAWNVISQVSASLTRAQLEQSRRRLSAAIEQTTDSVVITNTAGTILYVNLAFEKTTGYSRAEAIGQSPRILNSGKQDATFYQELWKTITAGQVWRGRFTNRKKDGSFYVEDATIAPVRDKRGKIVNYIATKRDITQELQLEEKYRQAQKMEAVGLLAGGIAHDFNNILTVILGYSGVLLGDLPPEDPRHQDVEQIKLSAERAAALTRQLLTFSRKQVSQPQIINLNRVISNLEKMLRRVIGEDITLIIHVSPELNQIEADPVEIEQILMNLTVNARDAMPTGGQFILKTYNQIVNTAYTAQYADLSPGSYIVLSVTDTGCGMDEATRTHAFEPFFTTKETGQGTGLGLSTVYGIVKQNKGHIEVESAPEQGTTFTIYFPQASSAPEKNATSDNILISSGGKETILLVEDEDSVRLVAAKMLQNLGYRVIEANSAEEAMEFSKYDGQIDLLVTDVIMPDMSGPELLNKLKQSHPHLKTLFISGYADGILDKHNISPSTVAFLRKPFSAKVLGFKVRELLDNK